MAQQRTFFEIDKPREGAWLGVIVRASVLA
jgi:hypothetical protein